MTKTLDGRLAPLNEQEADELKKIKVGHIVECKIIRKRNPEFHRRFFALLQVGFDVWSESAPRVEHHGQQVLPNFERFREEVTVLAGYYEPVFNLKGELRLQPRSISFAHMDQDDFEGLFSQVINVLLRNVLSAGRWTEESLREHVERVLAFDR